MEKKEGVGSAGAGEKGFENNQGEYNCFINVVLQALWHLRSFRNKFSDIFQKHACVGVEKCVHCALGLIFAQYQYSEDKIIPPTALRKALAILYESQSRFQLQKIDDAAEAFEAVLEHLHSGLPSQGQHATCPCVAHDVFGLNNIQQLRCRNCGSTTDPISSTIWIAYAYTFALRAVAEQQRHLSFCQILRKASEEQRLCPNTESCHHMCPIDHYLLRRPEVFTVGLVYTSPEGAPIEEIAQTFDMISMRIDLNNIFLKTDIGSADGIADPSLFDPDDENLTHCFYRLRGMICYYGQHYNAYFNSFESGQWFVFDDITVNPVGTEWSKVKERCLRGHLQPSVLFYEKSTALSWSGCSFMGQSLSPTSIVPDVPSTPPTPVTPPTPSPTPVQPEADAPVGLSTKMSADLVEELKELERSQNLRDSLEDFIGDSVIVRPSEEAKKGESEAKDQTIEEKNPSADDDFVVVEGDRDKPMDEVEKQALEASFHKIHTSGEINLSFWKMSGMLASLSGEVRNEAEGEVDIEVVRKSWLYRNQRILYRFTTNGFFLRLEPDTHIFKERFPYEDIEDITVTDSKNMVIRFTNASGLEAQYCYGDQNEQIINLIQTRKKSPLTLIRY